VADEEAVKPGHTHLKADIGKRRAQFFKRDVLAGFPDRQDIRPPRLNSARPHVAALGLWSEPACVPPLRLPTAVEGATPNRLAAARQLIPSSTEARTRESKSIDSGWPIHAGPLHQHGF